MRPRSHTPTLVLTRVQFYVDCTVGRLSDAQGRLLCMTLESRWHDKGHRHEASLPSCIKAGDYYMKYHFDASLRYPCWCMSGRLRHKARLCFLAKDGSVATHPMGDILVGYLSPVGDGEQPFDGRLYRPVEAYERLRDYYYALRANHGDFLLRVEPTPEPVTILPAVEAPTVRPEQFHFEDYILQTL